jgi:hypothetical protein
MASAQFVIPLGWPRHRVETDVGSMQRVDGNLPVDLALSHRGQALNGCRLCQFSNSASIRSGRVEPFGGPFVDRREEVARAARAISPAGCGPYPANVALRGVLGVPELADRGVHVDIMTAYELLGGDLGTRASGHRGREDTRDRAVQVAVELFGGLLSNKPLNERPREAGDHPVVACQTAVRLVP